MERSVFQRCALTSGLLTQADLDAALSALGGSRVMKGREVNDDQLAAQLIQMGRLNRWQAESLKQGRTKFRLGPYHIIDSLGQGGMGQVFKAEHTIMGRIVAVKVLPRSRSTPEAIASFKQEIRTQGKLDHENLVRAFDAGHEGNVHFLVTEYVPGTDLRRLIRAQGKMSMHVAASIIAQAARGLEHAHSRGLIHRDVKPGNLIITPDGRTKVSDLGLAAWLNESEQEDIYGGKVVGTADYLAPEQLMAPDKLSAASDVYSLGCTLYYAVTTKVPFPGGTAKDKAKAHCTQMPIDPRRLNPEMTDAFADIVSDMMAKQPERRLQTMRDVAERLSAWTEPMLPTAAGEPRSGEGSVIRLPANLRILPSDMSDTEPFFNLKPAEDDDAHRGDSFSQGSLGTHNSHDTSTSKRQSSFWSLHSPTGSGSAPTIRTALIAAVCGLLGALAGAAILAFTGHLK